MEASQSFARNVRPFQKSSVQRRVWTRPEEDALILGLKALVDKGWKCDNSFRPGYLRELEAAIKATYPNSHLTGKKHINSKLTVWKKVYAQVQAMRETSGFGWINSKQMISVPDDVWDTYVKVHPDVDNMRYKSFPFYEDWCEIFGKDRATGELAQQVEDAILDLETHADDGRDVTVPGVVLGKRKDVDNGVSGKGKANSDQMSSQGFDEECFSTEFVDENVESTMNAKKTNKKNGGTSKLHKDKRRKSLDSTSADPLLAALGVLFDKQNATLEAVASRIGNRRDLGAEKSKQVFDIVNSMTVLPRDMRIRVAQKIVKDVQQMDLFINMDGDSQSTFVQMMLEES